MFIKIIKKNADKPKNIHPSNLFDTDNIEKEMI
jgi:hypothetical protein